MYVYSFKNVICACKFMCVVSVCVCVHKHKSVYMESYECEFECIKLAVCIRLCARVHAYEHKTKKCLHVKLRVCEYK